MNPNGQEGPEGDEPDYHPEEFEGQSAGEMELFIVPPNLPRTRQKRPSSRGKAPAADESGPAAQRRRTSEASEPAASEQPQSQCPQQSSSTSSRLKSEVWMDFTKISQDGAKVTVAECKHCKAILSADSKNGTSHLLRHTNQQHKTDQSTVNNFFLKSETNDDGTPVLRNVKYDVHAARQLLLEVIQSAPGRVSFTSDNWKSEVSKHSYICITCHYIDAEWKLNKRIVWFKKIDPPYDGASIADEVHLAFRE